MVSKDMVSKDMASKGMGSKDTASKVCLTWLECWVNVVTQHPDFTDNLILPYVS